MDYNKRTVFKNKTFKFLIPVLRTYGEQFKFYLNNLDRRAFGVNHKAVKLPEKRCIFILFNKDYKEELFYEFLEFVREKSYYVTDYIFGNAVNSNFHMVVIKFPDKYADAYDKFIKGNLSQMYSEEDIENYFNKDEIAKKIMKKEDNAVFFLIKEINELFGNNIVSVEEILNNKDKWEFSVILKRFEEF